MSPETILEKVTEIFRDIMDDDTLVLERAMTSDSIPAWDSMAHISLIVAIEREFRIKFALDEMNSLASVGELLDLIGAKTA